MPYRFLFRGTTLGFEGNYSSITLPRTSTSTNPIKALWFALECRSHSSVESVVYLCLPEKLIGIESSYNFFAKLEGEIAFSIKPEEFYPLCEGYIHLTDLQKIMLQFGIPTNFRVEKGNLTAFCKETPDLNADTIRAIVDEIRKYLKK